LTAILNEEVECLQSVIALSELEKEQLNQRHIKDLECKTSKTKTKALLEENGSLRAQIEEAMHSAHHMSTDDTPSLDDVVATAT